MPYRKKCAKCSKNGALNWTLFNGHESVVVTLCVEDSQPLIELVNLVGTKPILQTGSMPAVTAVRVPKVTPLDWRPRS